MSALTVTALTGSSIADVIPALARLRIAVFREYPYLYEGSMEYEAEYLETYVQCEQSVIVVVKDGEEIIGASSGLPLSAETENLREPFAAAGWDVERVFYLAESVLLPVYRGRGLGHMFFDHREAHARALGGFTHTAFCAVQRDVQARPLDAPRSLEGFWRGRGYSPEPELMAVMHWQEVGQAQETEHRMQFWTHTLER